jgi:hypothetical protein
MIWMNKLRFAAAGVLAAASVVMLGTGQTAREAPAPTNPPPPIAKTAGPPALVRGKWTLVEWPTPIAPRRDKVLTIEEKDGKPVVTAVEGDIFHWTAKDLSVSGRHVRMTLTYQEGPLEFHFDGLFDPADPTRVLGSLAYTDGPADRVTLELVRPDRPAKLPRVRPPAEFMKWVEEENKLAEAAREYDRRFKSMSPVEQARSQRALQELERSKAGDVAKPLRALVAEQPTTAFGFEASEQLLAILDNLKPTAAEVDSWAKVARTFAATQGPQFESATVDFTLTPGEPFGGTLKLRSGDRDGAHGLAVMGPGAEQAVFAQNGRSLS